MLPTWPLWNCIWFLHIKFNIKFKICSKRVNNVSRFLSFWALVFVVFAFRRDSFLYVDTSVWLHQQTTDWKPCQWCGAFEDKKNVRWVWGVASPFGEYRLTPLFVGYECRRNGPHQNLRLPFRGTGASGVIGSYSTIFLTDLIGLEVSHNGNRM